MTLDQDTPVHKYQTIPCDAWTTNDWADFYSFEHGVNVLPADTGNPDKDKRKPKDLEICGGTWTQWKNEAIPNEIHEEWKKRGSFEKYGIAIICDRCWRKIYKTKIYCNGIDNDNKIATDELWSTGLEEKTMVEQHTENLDKSHIFFFSEGRPMKQRKADEGGIESRGFDKDKVPIIEVQSGGKLMFVTPSPHRDGSNYGIVGTTEILNVPVEQLEKMVDDVCEKYGLHYLKSQSTSVSEKIENLKFKTENTNRQGDILSIGKEWAM